MFINLHLQNRPGAIAILTLLGVTIFGLLVMNSLATAATRESQMGVDDIKTTQTFYAAEAGLNQALYGLITDPVPGSYNLSLNDNNILITVGNCQSPYVAPCDSPLKRMVESRSQDSTGKVRIVSLVASTSSFSGGFDSAVQAGSGGVFLDNNSVIIGKVYSNGSILPASGGATGEIRGDATVAGAGGILDKVRVVSGTYGNGDAYAHTISRSQISGQAYYQTISNTTVGGLSCPNSNCHPASPDPSPRPLPISDSQIQAWRDDITGGELNPNPTQCPNSHNSDNTYCVTSSASLGNQKINGNLYVGKKTGGGASGVTLTLNGNIWVTGNIYLENNGTIQINSLLEDLSVVIVSDGYIDINNNYTIIGSGDAYSFMLLLSTNTNDSDALPPAIYAGNGSSSIIYASPKGRLKVKNVGNLNAAATKTLYLEPNSTVSYNPYLAYFTVGGGGGEQVGTALGSWKEK